MGLVSLLWGIVSIFWMVIALIPLLGAANWLLIPFASIGAVIGAIGIAITSPGNRGRAKAGIVLNVVAILVGIVRLHLGFGLI
ncbi:hypothetical protein LVB87_04165 [Lysobacter sp. KIS68-7]|uniref:hypothetical protein n=1 Tax=Lysobacter sp. KIS68-7 TaxID=2904252 RepID=UPI001E5BBA79|nr:hypothetical protein [Lysobacter sp. KIS68-7]UHQ20364.1 hypothetical protein LVB87_04165 [Lysobacter sp. KIS68-7]